jgi:hypothetical protein
VENGSPAPGRAGPATRGLPSYGVAAPEVQHHEPEPSQPPEVRSVLANFGEFFESVDKRWAPGREHGDALDRRRKLGSAEHATDDPTFVEASFKALQRFRAFRPKRVLRDTYREGLVRVRELLPVWEARNILEFDPEADTRELIGLFAALKDVKLTRTKWVATSKMLYHLLPDLVVPIDRGTARFLGASGVPPGLDPDWLACAYRVFTSIARGLGARRLGEYANRFRTPLGLARVVDFGIQGFMTSLQDARGTACDS